ncbi:hypothetical protein FA95DRAFT_339219 [Auriscalpium vulgare]|uniref:Uncharacterized protein n=1 Tax=Auriscalpium vulgare TaxID=40419 RepID=A0ACB8RJ74_9AGAM|nr:hypothetical protein FA95DRAFT_339219 [Auriscalpium vulgare]
MVTGRGGNHLTRSHYIEMANHLVRLGRHPELCRRPRPTKQLLSLQASRLLQWTLPARDSTWAAASTWTAAAASVVVAAPRTHHAHGQRWASGGWDSWCWPLQRPLENMFGHNSDSTRARA